ncbi:PREDICTED: telomere repeats-binding bouquet formation protein 1 isoform X1 [Cyprinodon variegatus]|uniref:telomere repeats-binding bouquet formation protein 1 isoform X1 n=2 Tax=Cyprinodon variegatus TaxID=28743 RepID=UPI0007426417|nr:PREDICTED: telomere repeats-binding bouquet formation protein 1 isoform X1 [Cyprinodon variegatus]
MERRFLSNNRNTTKTDLTLLLECLKFQMKCPDLQKQALLTIHSICEKKEDNVDLLRELGGVTFLYNLSKSSVVHSDVKETALFTLGTLAEANVYCKHSLCRKEIFMDIVRLLTQEDASLNQKRVSVYLLFVLVSQNKSGQTLAQTTGCLETLMELFRSTFPFSAVDNLRNVNQNYQLWASVSIALCGCVNNPQNEEGQRVCVAAFPIVKTWLQQISVPSTETFQPICSFIAMTVSSNAYVQESFAACGGLETLTVALLRIVSTSDTSLLSRQVSVIIVKTLSACIADNSTLASGLAQYDLVNHLFFLLASTHLDPEDRLSVLLTIGECTGASVEHQSQLVGCGGVPLMITFLTEDSSEEVKRAATFILQTCKKATLSLGVQGLVEKQVEIEDPLLIMERFRSSAREMLRKIEQLEKRQLEEVKEEQETKMTGADPMRFVDRRGICMSSEVQSLEGGNESHAERKSLFRPPLLQTKPEEITGSDEVENSDLKRMRKATDYRSVSNGRCAGCVLTFEDVTSRTFASFQSSCENSCDMHRVLQEATERFRMSHLNCGVRQDQKSVAAGHADPSSAKAPTPTLQRSCEKLCGLEHKPKDKKYTRTEPSYSTGTDKSFLPQHTWRKHKGFTLTPLYKTTSQVAHTSQTRIGPSFTPLKRSQLPEAIHPAHM